MSANTPGDAGRRRVRPAIRRIAIVFFAILLPVAAHSLWDQVEMRRLISAIEAIRAKGEPVTDQEAGFGHRTLTSEQQRAGYYYMAAATLALDSQAALELRPMREWLAGGAPPTVPASVGPRLRTSVDNAEEALSLADKANALDFNGFPPGTDYPYRVQGLASLPHLIAARTLSASLSKRGDDAIDSALAALRARRISREVGWLGASEHETAGILSLSRPSVEGLLRLQRALEAEDRPEESADRFAAERARFLERVWRRFYGGQPGAPGPYTFPGGNVLARIYRPWVSHRVVGELQEWATLLEVARLPWPRKAQVANEIVRQHSREESPPWFVPWAVAIPQTAFPYFAVAVQPRQLIIDRAAVTALALERFRRDHNDRLPATLQELVPQYIGAVPIDPITGAPLLYRIANRGYTIYSLGADQQDDGGDLTSTVIEHGQPQQGRGRDIGIRVIVP